MAIVAGRWIPQSATADARVLLTTRSLRGFADGAVSVLLPSYLIAIGFSAAQVGAIVFSTLLGSAALTLAVGLLSHRVGRKRLLLGTCILMCATGIGFAASRNFWALFFIAVAGTLNPSAGDVSIFLPIEQAALTETVEARDFTVIFALYNVGGSFAGALGALASGLPLTLASRFGWTTVEAQRSGFFAYSAIAILAALLYLSLSAAVEADPMPASARPLAKSRTVVLKLSALFSIDAFGGGFVVQSLLALWLFRRFGLSVQAAGTFFFATGLLGAMSQFLSSSLAARIGRINTMVFTHVPANLFLMLAALMPTAPLALGCLLLRASMSSMDVPARQSYVMAVVPPEERAAAASVTNVPRSLASAFAPLPSGLLLDYSLFGWPLLIGGGLKVLYDVLLLMQFRAVRPSDEQSSLASD
ncbi:MAG: MFS transporter [Candidatus Binatus sp.]|uniref:MFS transporter n=1 Tax=Candidatus Binatus sp. TaxID=2811406 RepID=UPI0027238990|nr:MFS transporter [Candidatus Binatus sp.]MDO8431634.1 MFS transporter [Candidatus Binatus sp.]